MRFGTPLKLLVLTVVASLSFACGGDTPAAGPAKAAKKSAASDSNLPDYEKAPVLAGRCGKICAYSVDETVITMHRDWAKSDAEYTERVTKTNAEKKAKAAKCHAGCVALEAAGADGKALVDHMETTCMKEKGMDFAMCAGKKNSELREKLGRDKAPEWSF